MSVRYPLVITAIGLALTLAATSAATAQTASPSNTLPHQAVVVVDDLSWTSDPEFGELDYAVVYGNVRSAQPYVYRLRANAPATLPLHTHGRSEYITVLSGTLHHAPEGAARSSARSCEDGCFILIPAGRGHQAWLEAGTVLQIHGTGPVRALWHSATPDGD